MPRASFYDDALAAAVRAFQLRHGLEESGSVTPRTLAALNVPVGERLRQLAAYLDRLAARASGFVLRSANGQPGYKPGFYLDSQ